MSEEAVVQEAAVVEIEAAGTKHLPLATYEQIVQAADLDEDTVDVPEWGMAVKVRGLPRWAVVKLTEEQDAIKADVLGLSAGVVEPVLDEAQAKALMEKDTKAVGRILTRILQLSGIPTGDEVPVEARSQATFREG